MASRSKDMTQNAFARGLTDFHHHSNRISEHEWALNIQSTPMHFFFFLIRIIKMCKVIWKSKYEKTTNWVLQICSQKNYRRYKTYRKRRIEFCNQGKRNEAAYALQNLELNHWNFLESLMLLRKYDVTLNFHSEKTIIDSKKTHEAGSKRGTNFLSLFTKATVNLYNFGC